MKFQFVARFVEDGFPFGAFADAAAAAADAFRISHVK